MSNSVYTSPSTSSTQSPLPERTTNGYTSSYVIERAYVREVQLETGREEASTEVYVILDSIILLFSFTITSYGGCRRQGMSLVVFKTLT
jgi:hypothetical protein